MTGLSAAVALLTRVPVRSRAGSRDLAASVPWFPVVGAFIGGLVALVYALAVLVLPDLVAATLAVICGALLTGAFHEDGLADVADAFAGGASCERRIEILDDPRLGTFGVLALASTFLLRVGAIAALDLRVAVVLIPAIHSLSRVAGVFLMRRLPSVVPGSLGGRYALGVTRGHEMAAVLVGTAVTAVLIAVWTLPAFIVCIAAAAAVGMLARAKIGGLSGDVLGATQQVAELALLLGGVALSGAGIELAAPWLW